MHFLGRFGILLVKLLVGFALRLFRTKQSGSFFSFIRHCMSIIFLNMPIFIGPCSHTGSEIVLSGHLHIWIVILGQFMFGSFGFRKVHGRGGSLVGKFEKRGAFIGDEVNLGEVVESLAGDSVFAK